MGKRHLKGVRHIQTCAPFLAGLSQRDMDKYVASVMLRLRFENGHICDKIPDQTLKKARLSKSRLYELLNRVSVNGSIEAGELPRLCRKMTKEQCGTEFKGGKRPRGGWLLMKDNRDWNPIYRARTKLRAIPRCTLILHRYATASEIRREIGLKVFEYEHQKTLYAAQAKKDRGPAATANRQELKIVGKESRTFEVHHSIEQLDPVATLHQAALPSKITSAKMNISRDTFFRWMRAWEDRGRVKRTKRRVKLHAVEDPKAFHLRYGIWPFCVGGLWYGQMSNLYQSLTDYRGPNAQRRSGNYGKTTKEILLKPLSL